MIYRINKNTQAIVNIDKGSLRSKIIEENKVRKSRHTPKMILNKSCTMFGSSYEGRKATVSYVLKSKSKLPVPVHLAFAIYMFPTTSIRNSSCIWLAYYQIKEFIKTRKGTLVYFKNGTKLHTNISYNQFNNQLRRTSQVIAYYYGIINPK